MDTFEEARDDAAEADCEDELDEFLFCLEDRSCGEDCGVEQEEYAQCRWH